jgi:hypothetical protein
MAQKTSGLMGLLWGFMLLVLFAGWFTQIAGLGSLQYNCNDLVSEGGRIPFATATQLPAGQTCGKQSSWPKFTCGKNGQPLPSHARIPYNLKHFTN